MKSHPVRFCATLAFRTLFFCGICFITGCALFGGGSEIQRARTYSVTAPQSWKQMPPNESDKAYKLPSKNVVTVTSSCNRNTNAPLSVLTKNLMIGMRNISIQKQIPLVVNDGDALFTQFRANIDGVPFYLATAVLRKSDCIFDLTLMGPKELPDSDVDEFVEFTKSFRYGKNK